MKNQSFFLFLFILTFSLSAQERPLNTGLSIDEQYYFVGMTLEELINRFGPPRAVYSARGNEIWQDDVVFQYTGVDFYIYRDRIWQVRFISTHGVSEGDSKAAVLLTLGNRVQDMGNYVLMPMPGQNWPLVLKVNFSNANNTGQVVSIFLYRSDY